MRSRLVALGLAALALAGATPARAREASRALTASFPLGLEYQFSGGTRLRWLAGSVAVRDEAQVLLASPGTLLAVGAVALQAGAWAYPRGAGLGGFHLGVRARLFEVPYRAALEDNARSTPARVKPHPANVGFLAMLGYEGVWETGFLLGVRGGIGYDWLRHDGRQLGNVSVGVQLSSGYAW